MKLPKLDEVVENAKAEREIHSALEIYPWVVMELVANDQGFVLSQFSLGDEYKADFIVATGFSGGWEIHFVELEMPSDPLFNREGNPSQHLVRATGQIRRWKDFADRHDKRPALVHQLHDAMKARDLAWADGREPTDSAGFDIMWPDSVLLMEYHVVIGRRARLNADLMRRKAAFAKTDDVELITYDRVLEVYRKQRDNPIYVGTVRLPH